MNIFLTNDDGIQSPNLLILSKWAKKLGNVTVVAPKCEQSGKSQAIDFRNQVEAVKTDIGIDCDAWALDSTPTDCVRFAVRYIRGGYDLVISGVNNGYNLGSDIAYSGTVGAVLEAARVGIKAIAVSTDHNSDMLRSEIFDAVSEFVIGNSLFSYAHILNINIPKAIPNGIAVTRQGGNFFSDDYISCGNDLYIQTGKPVMDDEKDPLSDIAAIRSGYISITPITECRTDLAAFDALHNFYGHF